MRDVTLSTLHNATVTSRKFALAKMNARRYGFMLANCGGRGGGDGGGDGGRGNDGGSGGAGVGGDPLYASSSLSTSSRSSDHDWGCAGESPSAIINEAGLPSLPAERRAHGVLVATSHLRLLLSGDARGFVRVGCLPCSRCDDWDVQNVLALHCTGKLPSCLNLSECHCLQERRSFRS